MRPYSPLILASLLCLLALALPGRASAQESASAATEAESAAFVQLLRSHKDALSFEALHQEQWAALWEPEALYVAPPQAEPLPAGLAQAVEQILAEDGSSLERPFGLDLRGRAPVEAFVRFWTGRGRATLARALTRMGRYEPTIRQILREEGVPEDLIYLCLIESAFSPRALSPANARGLWQFIPATAGYYGLRIDGEVDERLDPVRSTRAAARYLKDLRQQLGSWPLAMAGYNAGGGHVIKAMLKGNSDSYWSLARRGALYQGARNYVAKILAVALIGRNREHFSMHHVIPAPAWAFESVQVGAGTSLRGVAQALELDYAELRGLNPELLGDRTPGRCPSYDLRVPPGSSRRLVAALDDLQVEDSLTYTTRVGETLEDVAERLDLAPRVLRVASGLPAQGRVPYGTLLHIPRGALASRREPIEDQEALRAFLHRPPEPLRGEEHLATALLPAVRFDYPDKQRVFYETQEGDTLEELEEQLKVSAPLVQMWNGLRADKALPRGLLLQLYVPQGELPAEAVLLPQAHVRVLYEGEDGYDVEYGRRLKRGPAGSGSGGGRSYRVKVGESVPSVARRFGVSAKDLKRWNNLRSNQLKPGYRLVIYGGRDTGTAPSGGQGRRPTRAAATAAATQAPRQAPVKRRAPTRSGNIRYRRH